MAKYRKKPVIIEAVQWTGKNFDEIMNFRQEFMGNKFNYENHEEYCLKTGQMPIQTSEGTMIAETNDWIIKDINGEFYPCKRYIFKKTYELVINE